MTERWRARARISNSVSGGQCHLIMINYDIEGLDLNAKFQMLNLCCCAFDHQVLQFCDLEINKIMCLIFTLKPLDGIIFHPLEVVSRYRDPQFQVGEKLNFKTPRFKG